MVQPHVPEELFEARETRELKQHVRKRLPLGVVVARDISDLENSYGTIMLKTFEAYKEHPKAF